MSWAEVRHAGYRKNQLFPELERTPDLTRGQARFAAEVAIAVMEGIDVPTFALQRAAETLHVMAKG